MTIFANAYFILMLLLAAWYQFVYVGIRRLSVSTLLLTMLIIIHGIPMLVYQHLTGPDTMIYEAVLGAVDREDLLARALLALGTMFFCVILGTLLSNFVFWKWRRQGQLADKSELEDATGIRYLYRPTTYTRLGIVATGLLMLTVMVFDGVPGKVFNYLSMDGSEIDKILLRREEGGIDNYFYNVMLSSIAPFLCAVALTFAMRQTARAADKVIAVVMVGIVFLGKCGLLSKAPPIIFLLQLMLLWFLSSGRLINFRNTLFGAIIVVTLFGIMVQLVIPELDFGATLAFLYYRIFDITNEGLIEYLAAYPTQIPHGWGSEMFAIFTDGPPKRASYFLVAALTRDDSLYSSSSNSLFIADAWAGYSWLGIVFTSTLAGFWTKTIDLYSFRYGRTDEAVCIVVGCTFGVFTMLSTAFPTALVTGGLATIPFASQLFLRHTRARARACIDRQLQGKA